MRNVNLIFYKFILREYYYIWSRNLDDNKERIAKFKPCQLNFREKF